MNHWALSVLVFSHIVSTSAFATRLHGYAPLELKLAATSDHSSATTVPLAQDTAPPHRTHSAASAATVVQDKEATEKSGSSNRSALLSLVAWAAQETALEEAAKKAIQRALERSDEKSVYRLIEARPSLLDAKVEWALFSKTPLSLLIAALTGGRLAVAEQILKTYEDFWLKSGLSAEKCGLLLERARKHALKHGIVGILPKIDAAAHKIRGELAEHIPLERTASAPVGARRTPSARTGPKPLKLTLSRAP